jgi:predicted acyltransferase
MNKVNTVTRAETKPATQITPPTAGPSRLESLDVFRGLTIAGMTIVNNPGTWSAVYPPLLHAEWHGWTPTDLIFPFFLFIVGVSMVFSYDARRARGHSRRELMLHVLKRSAVIFALGLFLNGFPWFNLATIRIAGVLQRIAVVYLIAGAIVLRWGRRGRIVATALCLFGYWALMMLVPVPGYGVGRLDPEGNLAAYVDRAVMLGHLWKPMWDPEGILSTIPAIATALLGVFAGEWLRSPRSMRAKVIGMVAWGVVGLTIGRLWHVWFPINKNLWTSSYVIFTAGFALVVLAVCYWLIDIRGWRLWGRPFVWLGVNPLAIYALSSFVSENLDVWKVANIDGREYGIKALLYHRFFEPLASPMNASLLWAMAYLLVWVLVAWVLYRKRIFIKI